MYSQIFFTNILRLLGERGMTKHELADKAHISISFLSDLTNGKANPSLKIMEAIADALDTPLPTLLEWTDLDRDSLDALAGGHAPRSLPEGIRFNLTSAKGEINYTIRASPKYHWLLPQLYTDLGRTHLKLKEADKAIRAFSQALNVNNAYEPAYRGLIDAFRAAGSPSSVLDVARSGLRNLPDSKYLKKVYLDSGGKEPFPEPALKKEVSPPVVKESDSNVVSEEEKKQLLDDAPSSDAAASQDSEPSDDANTERACRFCPPEEIEKRWRESFESESVKQ